MEYLNILPIVRGSGLENTKIAFFFQNESDIKKKKFKKNTYTSVKLIINNFIFL